MDQRNDHKGFDAPSLRLHPLFKHLNEEQLQAMTFNNVTESYKRGSIIYREGQRIKGFYIVIQGITKIYKTGFDGKEQILRFAKTGDIIGYRSVISDEAACTTAEWLETGSVMQIPRELLLDWIRTNGNFAVEMMKLICKELGEANAYITDIAQKTVKERLAEVLLILDDEFGTDGDQVLMVSLTREELSNIVGTATESIIRLLSDFKHEGVIALNGRKIKILDKPGLKRIANM
ncbi:MAG: Crp/Fnr family transcriptional regulator [Bacteroidales bacterium]